MKPHKRHINKIELNYIGRNIYQCSWGIYFREYMDDDDDNISYSNYYEYDRYDLYGNYVDFECYSGKDYPELFERGYKIIDMYSIYPIEIKRIKIIDDILS